VRNTASVLSIVLTGCLGGSEPIEPGDPPIDPPIDPPVELSPIERCLTSGGTLQELWATSNQHGPVTSIAVEGSTVVLGSADGSVKQWSVDGSEPSYGRPFQDDVGVVATAVAFTGDGSLVAGDASGKVTAWDLGGVSPVLAMGVGDRSLVSVAGNASHFAVARGETSFELTLIDRMTGAASAPLRTLLWGSTVVAFAPGGLLYTAGHNYGVPSIERRELTAPDDVVSEWFDPHLPIGGNVLALAVDRAVTTLVAGGSGWVAEFDPRVLTEPRHFVATADHVAVGTVLLGRDLFATAGQEGTLRIWSNTAEPLAMIEVPEPVGVGIDGAGTTLFTSGPDGELHAFGCR